MQYKVLPKCMSSLDQLLSSHDFHPYCYVIENMMCVIKEPHTILHLINLFIFLQHILQFIVPLLRIAFLGYSYLDSLYLYTLAPKLYKTDSELIKMDENFVRCFIVIVYMCCITRL